jgi:hypothetical protein
VRTRGGRVRHAQRGGPPGAESLSYGFGVAYGGPNDEDKALLRASSEALDGDARSLVTAMFFL